MNISPETTALLRSFAAINPNLFIRQGSTLKTISPTKTVIAHVDVKEDFPVDIGIDDLREFLGALALLDTVDSIDFGEKKMTISGGPNSIDYFYADPEYLKYPKKDLVVPDAVLSFTLTADQIAQLQKASSTFGEKELSIFEKSGRLVAQVGNVDQITSNKFSLDLGEIPKAASEFSFVFNMDNLKIVSSDYVVDISVADSGAKISKWVGAEGVPTYWIAMEKSSKWESE